MKRLLDRGLVLSTTWFLVPGAVFCGTFSQVLSCPNSPEDPLPGGFCVQGTDSAGAPVQPFAIVHPPGYDGTASLINVDVCVSTEGTFPSLETAVVGAIAKWSNLISSIGNCEPFCAIPEDPAVGGILDIQSVVLHELGHALGLGHPNLFFRDPQTNINEHTSFSAAYEGSPAGVLVGADAVRGSRDDFLDAVGPGTAVNVHWFRTADNDPFVSDATPIDINSYSRATSDSLPTDSTWAANANFCHGFQLGHDRTQSVMYSILSPIMEYSDLSADDVNMIRLQQAGQDRLFGTSDDYVAAISFVLDCVDAEIRIGWDPSLGNAVLGRTLSTITPTFFPIPPAGAPHLTVEPLVTPPGLVEIVLNPNQPWDIVLVFFDGFETGDFSQWTSVNPVRGPMRTDRGRSALLGEHPYFCPVPPPTTWLP
jgi:hypothetical protein